MNYCVNIYKHENGRAPFKDYMDELMKDGGKEDFKRIYFYVDELKDCGLKIVERHPKAMKHLGNRLYELKIKKHRVFFFHYNDKEFVILHMFRKKTPKTPQTEIENALREMKKYEEKNKNGKEV